MADEESTGTVLVALAANLAIAVAKIAAGLIGGSSAMLAEGAHSVADTLNQGFLLTSLRRSARPPDHKHPFGYGNERYFWSLLAAFGIFVAGGGFSIFEGLLAIFGRESGGGGVRLAYAVLALGFLLEGTSWVRAFVQARRESPEGVVDHVRRSPDLTFKAALFEDTAAMIGLVLAAAGLTLREITGSHLWDGLASILIGVLLIVVAYVLGRDSKALIIGRAADPDLQLQIRREIEATRGVDGVDELLTMHFGPDDLLVAARVHFSDDISADQAEDVAGEVDQRLQERLPAVRHVFLDPTQAPQGRSQDAEAAVKGRRG